MEVDRPPALFLAESQDGKLLSNLEWPNTLHVMQTLNTYFIPDQRCLNSFSGSIMANNYS